MGIKGLAQLIHKISPDAISNESELKKYSGKTVAIDASVCLYQSLIAVSHVEWGASGHLSGVFLLNVRMLEHGIRPVFVFDGRPPMRKRGMLGKRMALREKAMLELKEAESTGDKKSVEKLSRKVVKVNTTHLRETKELLTMIGVPYVQAPGEAEAQCAAMVRAGLAYATATEDMDSLTFGSSVLLRGLTQRSSRKISISKFDLDKVLTGFKLSLPEFIDLSILLGCDYCGTINQVGPKRALDLIYRHRSIDEIVRMINKKAYTWQLPENWKYEEARELFVNPTITDCAKLDLSWGRPDRDSIMDFLCVRNNLGEITVRKGILRLETSL